MIHDTSAKKNQYEHNKKTERITKILFFYTKRIFFFLLIHNVSYYNTYVWLTTLHKRKPQIKLNIKKKNLSSISHVRKA